MNFKNIQNKDLTHFGYREEPFFPSDLIAAGMTDKKLTNKIYKLKHPIAVILANYDIYNIQPTVDAFNKALAEKIQNSDSDYIDSIVQGCMKSGNNLLKLSKNIHHRSANSALTRQQLFKLLSKFQKNALNYCIYYLLAWFEPNMRKFAAELSQKYGKTEKEQNEIYNLVCTPSKETAAEFEQDDFLKILSKLPKEKNKLENLAKKHAQKYGWLGVRYFIGKPWNQEDVLERIRSANKKGAGKMLKNRLLHRNEIELKVRRLMQKISTQDKKYITQTRNIIYLRTQRADFFHQASFYLQPLLKQIAKKLNLTYRDLLNFSPDETMRALKGTFNPLPHVGPRRQNHVIFFSGKGKSIEGNKATKFIQTKLRHLRTVKKSTSVNGIPAFKGLVRGTVKIILKQDDCKKIEKGDILATTMTTPNFISAMEKAAAFVTDEGGILCHAAIVSREMKKPCVIGTKIATKIFKDGDLVEVNANTGTVKLTD